MRSAFALKRYGGQLPRDHGSAEVGAGYGDRTRLTGLGSQDITTMLSPPAAEDRSTATTG